MSTLRPGLLDGLAVALDGPPPDGHLAEALQRLGARVVADPDSPDPDGAEALIFDGGPSFAAGGDAGLMAMLQAAWAAVLRLGPDLIAAQRPGKLVLLAPSPQAGPLAGPAADALENLARTLSVEWARHGITTCAIAAGPHATPDEIAQLVAYLLSPAGDYFTGTRLQLGAQRVGSSAQGTTTASS